MSSPGRARIGVIGCGWWATHAHLPALTRNPDAEVVALAEPEPERLAAAGAAFGITARFADAAEMLDAAALDGVVIAAPHALHYELASAAIGHGVHVLLEKPMVVRPAHGASLVHEAREAGVELIIGYPYLYNAQARALRAAIAEGRIGTIEFVTCLFASTARELYRGNPEAYRELFAYKMSGPAALTYSSPQDGGQALSQITHSASLLFWLTGLTPSVVGALTEPFELGVDLVDAVSVRFTSGAVGTVASTGSVLPGGEEVLHLRVFGTGGHISFDVNRGLASIYTGSVQDLPVLATAAERYPEHAPADNLVDVILGRLGTQSPPDIALTTVSFIAAIHASAAAGGFVDCEVPASPADRPVPAERGT